MAVSAPYLIVCATPRTGSTLLTRLLRDSGVCVGCDEFLNPDHATPKAVLPELGVASMDVMRGDLERYVDAVKRHYADSGKMLCVKLLWSQFVDWQPHGLDLERFFPGARYLFLRRTNLAAQTASLLRAQQTGSWTAEWQA